MFKEFKDFISKGNVMDLAVGVINNTFLDNGRLNDIVHFLRYDNSFPEIFSHRLIEVLDIVRHVCRSNGFPRFFNQYHLADTL